MLLEATIDYGATWSLWVNKATSYEQSAGFEL